jgi:hypothetical protein
MLLLWWGGRGGRGLGRRRRSRRKDRWYDACVFCDVPLWCDIGLFSGLLTAGAVLARPFARPDARSAVRPDARSAVRPDARAVVRPDARAVVRPGARSVADRAGLAAIRGYRRWLSPRMPTRCPYTPTCGAYGLHAVERYGLATGGRLAAARLRRCRPGVAPGTPDPVPDLPVPDLPGGTTWPVSGRTRSPGPVG